MKINRPDNLHPPALPSSYKTDGQNGFRQIFDSAIDKVGETTAALSDDSKMTVIEHGDKLLNLLDNYVRELNDPSKTLKEIGPLVDRIEKEVSLMETKSASKVFDDKELTGIIKDLTVTANVAVCKFQRGDYI